MYLIHSIKIIALKKKNSAKYRLMDPSVVEVAAVACITIKGRRIWTCIPNNSISLNKT